MMKQQRLQTLNKYARGARSMKDLRKIENDFPEKKNKDNAADVYLIEPIQGSCEAVKYCGRGNIRCY